MQAPNPEERGELSRAIMHLLDRWGVPMAERIALLDLPANNRTRHLRRYADGEPLPDRPEIWSRVSHLVGIAEALYTTYPLNREMASLWMKRRHRRFGDRAPVAVMLEDGLAGILSVREYLDCAYAWERDEWPQAA